MHNCFHAGDILVPQNISMKKWACVACDQFSSQPEYWDSVSEFVGDSPSTFHLIVPEAYLNQNGIENRVEKIHNKMDQYLDQGIFRTYRRSYVYLERAMAADGRFGGHIVSGHIDGVGTITEMKKEENAVWVTIAADEDIMRLIVEKGSAAIDGISLTVAKVNKQSFSVSIIPHTGSETAKKKKKIGDKVNLENDIIGKYVEKLLNPTERSEKPKSKITMEFLRENGF